jgi:BolA family transcriptional regulator, general stress-responsive regulator
MAGVNESRKRPETAPGKLPESPEQSGFESVVRERLAGLKPLRLELIDDSARHAGHAGAASGGGHYRLLVVAQEFAGKSTLARHRLVYDALGELMRSKIHALSIRAVAPEEAQQSGLLL